MGTASRDLVASITDTLGADLPKTFHSIRFRAELIKGGVGGRFSHLGIFCQRCSLPHSTGLRRTDTTGISHDVNVHKGPLYLQWGNGSDGCRLQIATVNISQ
ncbi:MAG: hypothetical protein QOE58_1431 [Actinomycetota bacterium]|nr:hypothetical protein [Actinomycetota bacterium]